MINHKNKRGGLFFTIDTIIAALVLTLTIVLVLSFYANQPVTIDTKNTIDNTITYITTTTMREVNSNSNFMYYDPNETQPDFQIHQKILYLMENGQTTEASDFIENIANFTIPDQFGFQYLLIDDTGAETLVFTRQNGEDEKAKTNLTGRILTYYIADNNTIQGPYSTAISVWI